MKKSKIDKLNSTVLVYGADVYLPPPDEEDIVMKINELIEHLNKQI